MWYIPAFIVLWRLRAHWGLRTFHLPVIHPFSFHSSHNAEPDVTSLHYYVKQQQQQKSNRSVKCISQSLSCIHAQQQLKCNGQPFQWSSNPGKRSSWLSHLDSAFLISPLIPLKRLTQCMRSDSKNQAWVTRPHAFLRCQQIQYLRLEELQKCSIKYKEGKHEERKERKNTEIYKTAT